MNKKQPFVVDSSVVVKWVNSQNEKYVEEANNILDDARADIIELFTSEVAKYEVAKLYDVTLVTENIKHQGKTKNIKVLALGNYSVDS